MRFKPIPEVPAALDRIGTIRRAVPQAREPAVDCCKQVVAEADWIRDRDDAADWLVFLRALGLVEEIDGAYVRTDEELERAALADRFLDRVADAEAVIGVLEESPRSIGWVRDAVTRSSGSRSPSGRGITRERVRRVLGWAVVFDLAVRSDDGYRRR